MKKIKVNIGSDKYNKMEMCTGVEPVHISY